MPGSSSQKAATGSKKHLDRLHRERRQNRLIIIGAITVLVLVVGLLVGGYLYQDVLRYQRSVATVNGENITANQFRAFTKYYRYSLIRNAESTFQLLQYFGNDPNFAQQLVSLNNQMDAFAAGQKALDQMIDNLLVRQEAAKRNITVSPAEVEEGMQKAMRYYANGTPTPTATIPVIPTATLSPLQQTLVPPTSTPAPTATPTVTLAVTTTAIPATAIPTTAAPATVAASETVTATATPAPTETPYTFDAYKSNFATLSADLSTNYGISEDTLRMVIENSLLREKLQPVVIGDVTCTEDQVWAQHILVDDPGVAQTLYDKLVNGEDWYKTAAQYSKDSSNKDNGGDLGWFGKGQMVKEFEDAAFSMTEPGQISQPVKSQFGYHIIRLVARQSRPMTGTDCTNLKDTKFQDWLKGVRTQSQVSTYDFWQEIVPLLPTMPVEIKQAVDALQQQQQQQQPAAPVIIPTPAP